jgi:hypothetical protein
VTRRPLQNPLNVEGAHCSTGGVREDDDCGRAKTTILGDRRRPDAGGKWKGLSKAHCREGAGEIEEN